MTVPLYNLTDTWNSGGTVFAAIQMNVTNTGHAAGSKLLDLQIGGNTICHVTDSALRVAGNSATQIPLFQGFFDTALTNEMFRLDSYGAFQLQGSISGGGALGAATYIISSTGFYGTSTAAFGLGSAPGLPDVFLYRDAAQIFAQRNGTNPNTFRVYNTYTDASNYERGTFDWNAISNTLTIGVEIAGTGSGRSCRLASSFGAGLFLGQGGTDYVKLDASNSIFQFVGTIGIGWAAGSLGGFNDTSLSRGAAAVVFFNQGNVANTDGWFCYGGQKRVTSDFTVTSSTALTNVTGLSVSVQAGRNYTFEAELYVTDAAAGGVQAAIAGTATATAIQYTGYTIADNAIKGKTNATALATAVGSTTTTETSGIVVRITGTITVNAAGTLTVQMAQNTSNGTATTAKRGSYFIVQDMP